MRRIRAKIHIRELFTVPPEEERDYFPVRTRLNRLFLIIERTASLFEPFIPQALRRIAIRRAEHWIVERLNGECGLGGIFPAIVNAGEALALLGYAYDHPYRNQCRQALQGLLVEEGQRAWCQPCTSPVWDTVLTCLAMQESADADQKPVREALDWLIPHQILDAPADWQEDHPGLPGGGWAFQYANPHYPDLDDTAAVAWALYQADPQAYHGSIVRAADWLAGMQSRDGGFAAFDADNTYYYLNEIPFADHGALLDPPTSDVTARCTGFLSLYGEPRHKIAVERGLAYLFREQEPSGAWFGRWGSNYIYGTWSVMEAFRLARVDTGHLAIRRAVQWLKSVQRDDGGWGESNDTYFEPENAGQFERSTSFQTAWALLALMAAGDGHSHEVRRGIEYLLREQGSDGLWNDPVVYGTRFSAGFLPEILWLYQVFPAVGAGQISCFDAEDFCVREIGIITAMRVEARCITSLRLPFNQRISLGENAAIWLCGMGEEAAREAAEGLRMGGASALMSFGFAGALDSRFASGAFDIA